MQPQQPNWLENLLPTIGSVGGSILGGLGGAALGTPADVVSGPGGTIAGGIAGASAGGALGQSAGKAAENFFIHNSDNVGDLAKNAVEGGIGGGLGEGTGLLAAKAGEALAPVVEKASSKLLGHQLQSGFKALSSNIDPTELVNKLSNNLGIHDANQIQPVLDTVNNAITPEIRNIVAGMGSGGNAGVNTEGITDIINGLKGTDIGIGLAPSDETKVTNTVQQAMDAASGQGQIGKQLNNATDAYGSLKGLEKAAAGQYSKAYDSTGAVINQSAHSAGQLLSKAADELGDRIFSPNGVPAGLSDDSKQAIISALEPLKSAAPKAYDAISSQVGDATDAPALRSIMADLVNGSKVASAAKVAAGRNAGASVGDILGPVAGVAGTALTGNPLAIGAAALPKMAESPTASRIAGAGAEKIADFLGGNTMKTALGAAGAGTGSLLGALPSLDSTGASASNGTAIGNAVPINGQMPTNDTINNANGATPAVNAQPQPQQGSLMSQLPVSSGLTIPIQQEIIAGMYGGPTQQAAAMPAADAAFNQIGTAQKAAALIPSLESGFNAAGGAQGPIGGLLQQLKAKFTGGAAGAYGGLSDADASVIAKALGLPDATGAKTVEQFMPQITENQTTAQERLQNILNALGSVGGGNQAGLQAGMGVPLPAQLPNYQAPQPLYQGASALGAL